MRRLNAILGVDFYVRSSVTEGDLIEIPFRDRFCFVAYIASRCKIRGVTLGFCPRRGLIFLKLELIVWGGNLYILVR